MIKPLLTRLLNHLVNQNSWARKQLQPFSGRAVCFKVPPFSAAITVLEDGGLAMAGETAEPEATVTIPLPIALRLLANDEAAHTLVALEGDTELAAALAKVLRQMRWDYEEDLSQLIGDIPSHQLAKFGRNTVSGVKRQTLNVAQMVSEYWQEEQPLIAKKRHVENFVKEVDTLREDVERLEKRLEKLKSLLPADRKKVSPEKSGVKASKTKSKENPAT